MNDRALEVWCFDEHAGELTDEATGLRFTYAESWHAASRPPLSQTLPLNGSYTSEVVRAFFGGLLPEGRPREVLARNLGVSAGNDFALLAALGGDTAGAISLLGRGERPGPAGTDVEWLDDEELASVIDELPRRPMHADEDGEYRLSLAGVQDKLPVVVGEDQRIGLTKGRTPSTHILKTPIPSYEGTIANEALCCTFGRLLGVDTVTGSPKLIAGREILLVERYDRARGNGVRRLHQEDFCQALGVPSQRKYQSEGGPGLADCFALIRRAAAVPAREALRLLDAVMLNFLVGNNDAHGKNYSLLYIPDSPSATLSPAYDVICTVAYRGLSRKMAMSIGGEYRPDYVQPRHLAGFFEQAGLGAAAARRRIRALAGRAPAAIESARATLAEEDWDERVFKAIVATVHRRAVHLLEMTAPESTRSAAS
jgi:serine/threonine-protein kinase HipA